MPGLMDDPRTSFVGQDVHGVAGRDAIVRRFQRDAARMEPTLSPEHEKREHSKGPARGRCASNLSQTPSSARERSRPGSSFRPHSSNSAREHFDSATSTASKLNNKHGRRNNDDKVAAETGKLLQGVAHLADELDGLFAEMGRQTAVVRAGQRTNLRLIANKERTIEVKLPRKADDVEELTIQIECRCDPHYHMSEHTTPDEALQRGLLEEVSTDIQVAESQRQVPDGPFRFQSLATTTHRLRFVTDADPIYICLLAKEKCHLEFFCRVWQGSQGADRCETKAKQTGDDDDEDKYQTGCGASVGMKLQVKLKARRTEEKEREANAGIWEGADGIVSSPTKAAANLSASNAFQKGAVRGRSFGDYIWDGAKPPRDGLQVEEAQKRVANLMAGPCNHFFTSFKRAKGSWVKKLSPECPRKLIKWLRKAVEDRGALTFLASAGVFQFFFQRQRELHIMRARMAMRQLVWYKALFAAARMRVFMVIVAKGREEAKMRALERKQPDKGKPKGHAQLKIVVKDSADADTESESEPEGPVEETRRLIDTLKKCKDSTFSPRLVSSRSGKKEAGSPGSSICPLGPGGVTGGRHTLLGGSDYTQRRRCLDEDSLREWLLAKQGFVLYPNANSARAYTQSGDDQAVPGQAGRNRQMCLSPGAQQRNFITDLGHTLGRQLRLQTPPAVDSKDMLPTSDDEDQEKLRTKALLEVNDRVNIVTIRPDEIAKLKEKCPGRTEHIGMNGFKQFYNRSRQRAADTLVRREQKQVNPVKQTGVARVRIIKRYLLQFFDNDRSDLPWLSLLESMMLVIHGTSQFQSHHEHVMFSAKLRSFNQVRKAAQKKPGLFPPIEATFWSHNVILTLATKLQRAMCRGDGALAWKNSLFEGCFEQSSERDPAGVCIYSAARNARPAGADTVSIAHSTSTNLLRKLAEVSGQFSTDSRVPAEPEPLGVELTTYSVDIAATTTKAHYPVHAFGEPNNSRMPNPNIIRHHDKVLELAHETVPRELRIEMLRRRRHEREQKGPQREDHPLEAHGDLKAQQRYAKWMMRTNVPETVRSAKADMLPYFDSLVSPDSDTYSPPLATRKKRDRSRHAAETADLCVHSKVEDAAYAHAVSAVREVDGQAVAAASDRSEVPPIDGTCSAAPLQAKGGGPAGSPQTADDIGKLFGQMDALQTILAVDIDIGGFANRCPAGWRSGYRAEPMSTAEIRRAHIVQKFCAGSNNFG